jgi:glutamate carboxypeptidase
LNNISSKPYGRKNTSDRDLVSEALLNKMILIDSPTTYFSGVNKMQELVATELSHLGFQISWVAAGSPTSALQSPQNLKLNSKKSSPPKSSRKKEAEKSRKDSEETPRLLHAWYQSPNHRPNHSPNSWITFVSHSDTVLSQNEFADFQPRPKALKAYGSGVIDNKGGLTVALRALQLLFARSLKQKIPFAESIRFICSPNEEAGSTGFHSHFNHWGKSSKLVLGFEPALDSGAIIDTRRGNRWYDIKVVGREAHAGRCRGEELNAWHELAPKLVALSKLADTAKGVSCNITQASGGRGPFNVVPGEANAKLDVRFRTFADRDALHRNIRKILDRPLVRSKILRDYTNTSWTLADDCPPFSKSQKSLPYIRALLKEISKTDSKKAHSAAGGGAGDVNHFSHPDTAVIDGLGPVGGGMHTLNEFVQLSSLKTRPEAIANFLWNISSSGPLK